MKQFIVMTAIQLCLCVCTVTAVEDCPAGFEKIKGIDHKCFYYYVDSTGSMLSYSNSFSDAQEICRGLVVQLLVLFGFGPPRLSGHIICMLSQ